MTIAMPGSDSGMSPKTPYLITGNGRFKIFLRIKMGVRLILKRMRSLRGVLY